MGRGLIIICTGMVFIFGMIQLGISNRHNSEAGINIDYASWVQARNVAASGAEVGIMELIRVKTWRPVNGLLELNVSGYAADVTVIDNTIDATLGIRQARVLSEATISGRTARVNALLQERSKRPKAEGAMGIYSPNVTFSAAGADFWVSGKDGQEKNGDQKYGIAVGNSDVYNSVMGSLHESQYERIEGKDGSPSIEEVEDRNDELMELAAWYKRVAQETSFGTYIGPEGRGLILRGGETLGTIEEPRITYADNTVDIRGSASGAGVLVISEQGLLNMVGGGESAFNFHGLVIVMGETKIRGNMHVEGTMLFGGTNPIIDINIGGAMKVLYSSAALANIDPFLEGTGVPINLPYELISMYE